MDEDDEIVVSDTETDDIISSQTQISKKRGAEQNTKKILPLQSTSPKVQRRGSGQDYSASEVDFILNNAPERTKLPKVTKSSFVKQDDDSEIEEEIEYFSNQSDEYLPEIFYNQRRNISSW